MLFCMNELKSYSGATMSSNVDIHQPDELECPHCRMPKAEDNYGEHHIIVPVTFINVVSYFEGKIRRKNREILMWREEND